MNIIFYTLLLSVLSNQNEPVITLETILSDSAIVDSISEVVTKDSILEINYARYFFKKQLDLKTAGVITKIDCVEFLLKNKIRTKTEAEKYLYILKNLCSDRQSLYYAVRKIIPDRDKYLAVAYAKKSRDECAMIQTLIDRISL